jgi:hypothetical protein
MLSLEVSECKPLAQGTYEALWLELQKLGDAHEAEIRTWRHLGYGSASTWAWTRGAGHATTMLCTSTLLSMHC